MSIGQQLVYPTIHVYQISNSKTETQNMNKNMNEEKTLNTPYRTDLPYNTMMKQRNCWKAKQKSNVKKHRHKHSCKKKDAKRDCHDGKSGFSVYNRCFDCVLFSLPSVWLLYLLLLCTIYSAYGLSISLALFLFLGYSVDTLLCEAIKFMQFFCFDRHRQSWHGPISHSDDSQK